MSASKAVVEHHSDASRTEITPAQMLQIAVQQGADLDRLQKLMDLQERWEANQARKAFVAAMAAFKSQPPEIVKDKHVAYTNSRNQITEYDHATLGGVCAAIVKGLSEHGISHRWDVKQSENRIHVTCILTHAQGHSESVSLNSAADDSGGKNGIQAIGSAITYLQRYTLLAATGLAAIDDDDDGKGTERSGLITEQEAAKETRGKPATQAPQSNGGGQLVTEAQATMLRKKAEQAGVSAEDICLYFNVDAVSALPFAKINDALKFIKDYAAA